MSDCRQCTYYASESENIVAHCTRYAAVVKPGEHPCEDYAPAPPRPPASACPAPTLPLLEAAQALLAAQPGNGAAVMECKRYGSWHSVGNSHRRPEECPACALRSAIAAEKERQKVRRAAAREWLALPASTRLLWDADARTYRNGAHAALEEWAKMETSR